MMSRAWVIGLGTAALIAGVLVMNCRPDRQVIAVEARAPRVSVEPDASVAPAQTLTPTRAPAQATVTALPQAIRNQLNELNRIEACYTTDCDYDRSYPRAYDYAVGRDLKATLIQLAVLARTQHYEFTDLASTGRHFLANDDGHVKEGALRLLATQPANAESLHAILDHVIGDTDAQLIEPALSELRKYPSERALIEQRLAASLLTGAPFVSEAISENLGPFINSSSFATFERVASRASEGSRIRANLRAHLSDFQKRQSGG